MVELKKEISKRQNYITSLERDLAAARQAAAGMDPAQTSGPSADQFAVCTSVLYLTNPLAMSERNLCVNIIPQFVRIVEE